MKINVLPNPKQLGIAAAEEAESIIDNVIKAKGLASIILATGTSQFETLKRLIQSVKIDWSKVTMFHLDEYIDLPFSHPGSFRKYLQERFVQQVPALGKAHFINGEGNPEDEIARLGNIISASPIDVALVGIGENGHLAFNDPPADFNTNESYIMVELDAKCRKQQMNEGWFETLEEVPKSAISMSVRQIMKSENIICSVPDARKAEAVRNTLENRVSNLFPATILQNHPRCNMYLDEGSASLVSKEYLLKAFSPCSK